MGGLGVGGLKQQSSLLPPKNYLGSGEGEVSQRLREGRVLEGCSQLSRTQQRDLAERRQACWPAQGAASVPRKSLGWWREVNLEASEWIAGRTGPDPRPGPHPSPGIELREDVGVWE